MNLDSAGDSDPKDRRRFCGEWDAYRFTRAAVGDELMRHREAEV